MSVQPSAVAGSSPIAPYRPTAPSSLQIPVHLLGLTAFLAYGVLAILSYAQASALWRTEDAPRAQAFFDVLAQKVRLASPRAAQWLVAGSWPADNVEVLKTYCLMLAVPTLACVGVLGLLTMRRWPARVLVDGPARTRKARRAA